jgi:WD40 repeat protein
MNATATATSTSAGVTTTTATAALAALSMKGVPNNSNNSNTNTVNVTNQQMGSSSGKSVGGGAGTGGAGGGTGPGGILKKSMKAAVTIRTEKTDVTPTLPTHGLSTYLYVDSSGNEASRGDWIYIGCDDGRILSSLVSGRSQRVDEVSSESSRHTSPVTCFMYTKNKLLCPNADGYLFSGSQDRTIKVWNPTNFMPTKVFVTTCYGHEGSILTLVDGCDGSFLSTSVDGTLRQWTPQRDRTMLLHPFFECTFSVSMRDTWFSALAVNPRGAWSCYIGDNNGNIIVYCKDKVIRDKEIYSSTPFTVTLTKRATWERFHALGITMLALSTFENYLISLSFDGTCKLADSQIGCVFFTVTNNRHALYTGMVWIPEQLNLYLVDELGSLDVFNTFQERIIATASVKAPKSDTHRDSILTCHKGQLVCNIQRFRSGDQFMLLFPAMNRIHGGAGGNAVKQFSGELSMWRFSLDNKCMAFTGHEDSVVGLAVLNFYSKKKLQQQQQSLYPQAGALTEAVATIANATLTDAGDDAASIESDSLEASLSSKVIDKPMAGSLSTKSFHSGMMSVSSKSSAILSLLSSKNQQDSGIVKSSGLLDLHKKETHSHILEEIRGHKPSTLISKEEGIFFSVSTDASIRCWGECDGQENYRFKVDAKGIRNGNNKSSNARKDGSNDGSKDGNGNNKVNKSSSGASGAKTTRRGQKSSSGKSTKSSSTTNTTTSLSSERAGEITCMRVIWSLNCIAIGHDNGLLTMWHADSGSRVESRVLKGFITGLVEARNAHSQLLVGSDLLGSVAIWNLTLYRMNPSQLSIDRVFKGYHHEDAVLNSDFGTGGICSLAFHYPSRTMFSGGDDHTIRSWRIQNDSAFHTTYTLHKDVICYMECTDSYLLSGDESGEILLWRILNDVSAGIVTTINTSRVSQPSRGLSLPLSPRGSILGTNSSGVGSVAPAPAAVEVYLSMMIKWSGVRTSEASRAVCGIYEIESKSVVVLHAGRVPERTHLWYLSVDPKPYSARRKTRARPGNNINNANTVHNTFDMPEHHNANNELYLRAFAMTEQLNNRLAPTSGGCVTGRIIELSPSSGFGGPGGPGGYAPTSRVGFSNTSRPVGLPPLPGYSAKAPISFSGDDYVDDEEMPESEGLCTELNVELRC